MDSTTSTPLPTPHEGLGPVVPIHSEDSIGSREALATARSLTVGESFDSVAQVGSAGSIEPSVPNGSLPPGASPAVTRGGPRGSADDLVETTIDELEELISGQQRAVAHVWHDRSISKTNLHLLMLLERFGTMTMSRLASLAMVSLPSLTGIVTRMEEHGLVVRLRDESDRRVVLVGSTARGQATIRELEAIRREYLRRVLGAMNAGDRRTCYAAILAMRRIAEQLGEEPSLETSGSGAGGVPHSERPPGLEPQR